ncbi:MAG: hypothetical protein M1818_008344 [Claussenomyces sp. TS43310]|nr:MAG: hypothetical protein M1818_008344 [Claussenomyces sp. TS43310]
MSSETSSAPKTDWLVIMPDREGVLDKRMSVRSDHFSNLIPRAEAGFWKLGGAMLTEPAKDGEPLKITGSALLAHASSREEVIEELKKDVYAKEVWDWDKIHVIPFKTAFLKG